MVSKRQNIQAQSMEMARIGVGSGLRRKGAVKLDGRVGKQEVERGGSK